jgi:hypothetical protein
MFDDIFDGIKVYTRFNKSSIATKLKISELPYSIHLNSGIATEFIEWCEENCHDSWGWYWVPHKDFIINKSVDNLGAYIGFANKDELTWFCLSNEYSR